MIAELREIVPVWVHGRVGRGTLLYRGVAICIALFVAAGAFAGNVAANTRTHADIQRLIDASIGGCAVLPPGDYEIGETIWIPSHTHLVLEGCRLRMKDGVLAQMFKNRPDADGETRDVVIDGRGSAVLDGGEPNGLNEFTSRKNGMPHVSQNLTIEFREVENFEIRDLAVRNQRWWAFMFLQCAHAKISKIRFFLDRHAVDSRATWRNQDGIDLRVGCHDFLIEDISGETGDDLIALTALGGTTGRGSANPRKSCDIRNVRIRRVHGRTNQCALIRLLAHYGQKIHHISIEDVVEDSFPGVHNHTQMAIRIGDRIAPYYGRDEKNAQKFGDISDITIDGLATRALTAVATDDSIRNLTVRNVRLFSDAQSVWTAGAFGIAGPVFIYAPDREEEVRNDWLRPRGATSRKDTVRIENVVVENVTVESRRPTRDCALFRFRKTECVNCVVRNVQVPQDRKLVENIDAVSVPQFENCTEVK